MKGLGFAPLIVATGGPTNPVGIAVTIGAGVALVVSKFLHPGAGRDEADYLTDPQTGAQTHAGAALAGVVDAYNANPDTWTRERINGVIDAIEKIRNDFVSYAAQFPRAGPGAIRTITSLTDRLIADRERERAELPSGGTTEGGTMEGAIRLYIISEEPYHRIDTGVVGGPGDVDPQQFTDLQAFYDYARSRGELIYQVSSVEEANAIVDGSQPLPYSLAIDPPESAGLPWYVWAGLAYAGKVLLLG